MTAMDEDGAGRLSEDFLAAHKRNRGGHLAGLVSENFNRKLGGQLENDRLLRPYFRHGERPGLDQEVRGLPQESQLEVTTHEGMVPLVLHLDLADRAFAIGKKEAPVNGLQPRNERHASPFRTSVNVEEKGRQDERKDSSRKKDPSAGFFSSHKFIM